MLGNYNESRPLQGFCGEGWSLRMLTIPIWPLPFTRVTAPAGTAIGRCADSLRL